MVGISGAEFVMVLYYSRSQPFSFGKIFLVWQVNIIDTSLGLEALFFLLRIKYGTTLVLCAAMEFVKGLKSKNGDVAHFS